MKSTAWYMEVQLIIFKKNYIGDSGATGHITYDESELTNISSCDVKVTRKYGNYGYTRKKGVIKLEINRGERAILKDMYMVPNLICTL